MKTRREALAEVGLAIPGARGKFSNAAKTWLAEQEAAGVQFADSTPTKISTKPAPTKESGAPSKDTGTGIPDYLFPSDFRFPEEEYVAFAREGGKKVFHSLREVCNNCRVSLVNHGCNSPVIRGNVILTIERK